ncbi:helicase RepA family protein [Palleronia sp.]|uniref:helicase RepA family protein n=1 Tax=Palleronia sp. TaxID=1940284 RepID=UPI0035C86177
MTDTNHTIDDRALPRIDLRESFSQQPPPLDLVLPGMIAGTVGALVAHGGAGKSWVALEVAIAVAGGPDLIGMGIEQTGRVLYLPAEDPSLAIRHRLWAAGSHLAPPVREQLVDTLEIVPLMGRIVDILTPAWADALERMAAGCRLVVIDTLRRFHSGDENAAGEMARLLGVLEAICSRTGTSILFLHHTNKGSALNGAGDQQQASRGSSVLVDNIRGGQWNLVGMTEAEARAHGVDPSDRKMFVRLSQAKANFGAAMPDAWLQRTDGGILVRAGLERLDDGGQGQDDEPRRGGRRRSHG